MKEKTLSQPNAIENSTNDEKSVRKSFLVMTRRKDLGFVSLGILHDLYRILQQGVSQLERISWNPFRMQGTD